MVSSSKPYIIVIKTGLKYESRKRLVKSKINITTRSPHIGAHLHVTVNDSTKPELKVKAATARSKVKITIASRRFPTNQFFYQVPTFSTLFFHICKIKSRPHYDVAYLLSLINVPTKHQLPTPYLSEIYPKQDLKDHNGKGKCEIKLTSRRSIPTLLPQTSVPATYQLSTHYSF